MPVIGMSMTGTTLRRGCLGARSLIEILKASRVSARSLARSKRCELAGWASARGTQTLSPERSKKIRARSAASEYFTVFVERVGLADCNWLNAVHCVPVSSATVLTSRELPSTPPHPDLPETLAMSRVRPVRVRPRPSKGLVGSISRTRMGSKIKRFTQSRGHAGTHRSSHQPTADQKCSTPIPVQRNTNKISYFGFTYNSDNFVRRNTVTEPFPPSNTLGTTHARRLSSNAWGDARLRSSQNLRVRSDREDHLLHPMMILTLRSFPLSTV